MFYFNIMYVIILKLKKIDINIFFMKPNMFKNVFKVLTP